MSDLREIAVKLLRGENIISTKELSAARLKTCGACEDFAKLSRQCRLCWCFMDAKVKLVDAKCPKGVW